MQNTSSTCTAIILPGGGARGAYQAGVLKAISELLVDDAKGRLSELLEVMV